MRKIVHLIVTVSFICLLFSCTNKQNQIKLEDGISKELAEYRSTNLKNIEFTIHFSIPENMESNIMANEQIKFNIDNINEDLQIDFREHKKKIKKVICNNKEIKTVFKKEHIIIDKKFLIKGKNIIKIDFIAGNLSLNRNKEYLYTLLVPDRACTLFPCFDQPDIKAQYKLSLNIPKTWIAIANSKEEKIIQQDNSIFYQFKITEPISTYLFAFAAGKFDVIKKEHNGKTIKLIHRETNKEKIANNVDEIFRIATNSLDWLENYTNIKYPYSHYNLVAIPFFQYGGMEHPGATLYRASKLFLDKQHTQEQKLARANLIAHETAHMWFGDLVTMKWFNDVWLKEVFANFMADKITTPSFPEINHKLKFIYNHFPSSYKVDRSIGANPIGQKLNNLKNAGSLYGAIIYHKSPIIMQQLENIMGANNLQKAIREYLKTYYNGNATWDQLVSILDKYSKENLTKWSKIWVYEPGMPAYKAKINYKDNKISSFDLEQFRCPAKIWNQYTTIRLFYGNKYKDYKYYINKKDNSLNELIGQPKPDFVNINGLGQSYGYFEYDDNCINYLSKNHIAKTIKDANNRGIIYINLWENMLNNNIKVKKLLNIFLEAINTELNPQNAQYLLRCIHKTYWSFLNKENKKEYLHKIEETLWNLLNNSKNPKITKNYFNSFLSLSNSKRMLDNIYKIWNKKLSISGLNLSENDYTKIACTIAIKNPSKFESITQKQLNRINNPDRIKQFKFIIPALSNDSKVRDSFFNSLLDQKNREHEPWVAQALRWLHHPLRAEESVKYINQSLEILKEIKSTGDIFFPKSWLDATFSGHNDFKTADISEKFLYNKPVYPEDLRLKILQATDHIKRAKYLLNQ